MADAGARKFDAVLVWKLDWFGRSLRLVNALAEFEASGWLSSVYVTTSTSARRQAGCSFT
jgi:hypothetical protein